MNILLQGMIRRLTTSVNANSAFIPVEQSGKILKTTPAQIASAGVVATTGTFTANGATAVTVTNSAVTANSQILVTLKTVGGTVGTSAPNVRTITPGTGFTIAGVAGDTSVYNYSILG